MARAYKLLTKTLQSACGTEYPITVTQEATCGTLRSGVLGNHVVAYTLRELFGELQLTIDKHHNTTYLPRIAVCSPDTHTDFGKILPHLELVWIPDGTSRRPGSDTQTRTYDLSLHGQIISREDLQQVAGALRTVNVPTRPQYAKAGCLRKAPCGVCGVIYPLDRCEVVEAVFDRLLEMHQECHDLMRSARSLVHRIDQHRDQYASYLAELTNRPCDSDKT